MDVDEDVNDQHLEYGDITHYPAPVLAIARTPTKPNAVVQDLIKSYGATHLISALNCYLISSCHVPEDQAVLSVHHILPVWHRFSLRHLPLPFAPHEPLKRDVVRARRAEANRAEAFDTVLFKHAPQKFGLERYRAARVRAIFGLPSHLQHFSPHRLVYLELFTPFPSAVSPFHRMYSTAQQTRSNGQRHCVVIPVTDVVMSCHLAPSFRHFEPPNQLPTSIDPLSLARRFFFNPYYNHYVFKICEHWRRIKARQ
ncbi:hypothetical protein FRC07_012961 [Ceratobasidium sp. 392]|nr:hypothetical protein FRC07_012961 [Ceratobasidium sp. 392]